MHIFVIDDMAVLAIFFYHNTFYLAYLFCLFYGVLYKDPDLKYVNCICFIFALRL